MKILGKRILLEKIEPEEKTHHGLLLPKSTESLKYKVIDTGDECEHVAPGDVVFPDDNAHCSLLKINGKTYIITEEKNIIVIHDQDTHEPHTLQEA